MASTFYDYLRTQFTDLAGAELFVWRWVNEMDQRLPFAGAESISSRALCAHVSAVLEGQPEPQGPGFTHYLGSQHGPALYWAAWGNRPDNEAKGTPC